MDVDRSYKVLRTGSLWHVNPPLWRELLPRAKDNSINSWLEKYDANFSNDIKDGALIFGKIEFRTQEGYVKFWLQWL